MALAQGLVSLGFLLNLFKQGFHFVLAVDIGQAEQVDTLPGFQIESLQFFAVNLNVLHHPSTIEHKHDICER